MVEGRVDVAFNDRRRALSEEWENRYLVDGYRYAEVSEASPVAWNDAVTCPQLSDMPCILVCPPEQREVEEAWWHNHMGFAGASSTRRAPRQAA